MRPRLSELDLCGKFYPHFKIAPPLNYWDYDQILAFTGAGANIVHRRGFDDRFFTRRREEREGAKGSVKMDIEELAEQAVDSGFRIHKELGPGLLESVYEALLASSLERRGLRVERQKPLPIEFDGVALAEGFRIDLLVEQRLIIEVKSLERLAPVHPKQLLTYLRLARQPLGLLMNFGCETFREGINRVVNNHGPLAPSRPSRLRVNQSSPIQVTRIEE